MSIRLSLLASVGGRYAGMAIQLVGSVILARLLPPSEFGLFGIAVGVITLSTAIRELGISNYLIQLREIDRQAIGKAVGLLTVASLAIGIPVLLLRHWIGEQYNEPRLADLIGLLTIGLLLSPFGAGAAAVLQRNLRFAELNAITIVSTLANIIVAITLAKQGHGAMSLAWGQLAQAILWLAVMAALRPGETFCLPRFRGWGPMLSFGAFSTLAGLAGQVQAFANALIVGRMLGFASVGLYDRALGVAAYLNRDLLGAIMQVIYVGLARTKENPSQLRWFAETSIAHITGLFWPAYAVLAVLSEPLIVLVFGDAWREAAPLLRVFALNGAFSALAIVYSRALLVVGRTQTLFVTEWVIQSARVGLILLVAPLGLLTVVWTHSLVVAVAMLVYLIVAYRIVGIPLRSLLTIVLHSMLLAMASALPTLLLVGYAQAPLGNFGVVALGTAASGLIWIALVLITRHRSGDEIKRLADRLIKLVR